jgi:signal recognition particle subunit SRP19
MAAMQVASISRRERNINTSVGAFNSIKKHSDQSRWICIYPVYFNSKKTVAEGRRLPVKLCVENPTSTEIRDVLQHAGLNCLLENHRVHPRELNKYELLYRGRVRVQIKNDENAPLKPEFATSRSFE